MSGSFVLPLPQWGLIGHRGALDVAPENSLEGVQAAAHLGLTWVEVDLQLTSDGTWVVFHDETLERAAERSEAITDCTWSQLKEQPVFGQTHIMDLKTLCQVIFEHHMVVNLEIKLFHPELRARYVQALLPVLQAWPEEHPLPLIASFDHELLHALHAERPHQPLGWLTQDLDAALIAQCAERPAYFSCHFEAKALDPEHKAACAAQESLLAEARAEQVVLFSYTVNTLKDIQHLLEQGVQGVFTDIPHTAVLARSAVL